MSDETASPASDTDTTTEAEAPEERDERREELLASFTDALGDAVVGSHILAGKDLWIRVSTDAWRAAAEVARNRLQARYFGFLSVIDWMPSPYGKGEDDPSADPVEPAPDAGEIKQGCTGGETRFQVFGRLTDTRRHVGITIKSDVPDTMSMPTWVHSFAGANWHERETHEMFGIDFEGHPDLRNIYLPSEFEGHPLRKDFPLLSRMVKPWPGIVDVEPMPGADEDEATAEAAAGEAAT